MLRRQFIESTGIMATSLYLPWKDLALGDLGEVSSNYKLGYQLYSIRDEMAANPISTLKSLKEIGYQDFELYGYDDINGQYYGFPAKEFKKILDDLELTITSGHYGFSPYLKKSSDELKRFVDKCIEGAKAIDSKYITWPWIDPKFRNLEQYKRMPDKLNQIGEHVVNAGLGFAYHNHGYEFDDHNGENGFDIIVNNTDPELVKLQLDLYWVMHSSKRTPKALIEKQPGRYVMWHIKDMDVLTRDYTELGNGSINYLNILPDPKLSGLEYFYIEQGGNFTHNSLQSATDSAQYYKNNLQGFFLTK